MLAPAGSAHSVILDEVVASAPCCTSSAVTCPVIPSRKHIKRLLLLLAFVLPHPESGKEKQKAGGQSMQEVFASFCFHSVVETGSRPHARWVRRLTYLLTPVTFDRDYSALQIIHRQGSIIIEAESESRRKKINESWEDVQENYIKTSQKTPNI